VRESNENRLPGGVKTARSGRLNLIAYERIKDEVFDQRILPREPLIEAELAARYGMSKTPVREALLALVRDGLLEGTPFRGVRVRHFTADDVREIYELREILEPPALCNSDGRLDDGRLAELREVLVRAEEAAKSGQIRNLSRLNRLFHRLLVAECGNSRIIDVLERLQDQLRLIALTSWAIQPSYSHESEQHWAILRALETHDTESAANLLHAHIKEFSGRYLRLLAPPESHRPHHDQE
jgi:DNA-binding GntR family transcriptional regulator